MLASMYVFTTPYCCPLQATRTIRVYRSLYLSTGAPGTRTRDLWVNRRRRYPLGHAGPLKSMKLVLYILVPAGKQGNIKLNGASPIPPSAWYSDLCTSHRAPPRSQCSKHHHRWKSNRELVRIGAREDKCLQVEIEPDGDLNLSNKICKQRWNQLSYFERNYVTIFWKWIPVED